MNKAHLGLKAVGGKIAEEYERKGMNAKKAKKIGYASAAQSARRASPAAKKANPRLNRVKG